MTVCRTVDEAYEAGQDAADQLPPLTQAQADLIACILAPFVTGRSAFDYRGDVHHVVVVHLPPELAQEVGHRGDGHRLRGLVPGVEDVDDLLSSALSSFMPAL